VTVPGTLTGNIPVNVPAARELLDDLEQPQQAAPAVVVAAVVS
jgi:hypothetical protein